MIAVIFLTQTILYLDVDFLPQSLTEGYAESNRVK